MRLSAGTGKVRSCDAPAAAHSTVCTPGAAAGAVSWTQATQGRYAGHTLVRSYIPKDWTIETNAQTRQRVNNLRSESIRGVNTHYTQNPDVFAASTGAAPLEFGVDYEELKQTGGDY